MVNPCNQHESLLTTFFQRLSYVFLRCCFSTQLESDDVHAKLHKPSAKRSDTGKYKVQLKNDSGADECDIDVIVLDKPGKPEGPLEATETTTDSVSLQWKPPKDDGGGDITGKTSESAFSKMKYRCLGYIVEKCPENSDLWERVPGIFNQPKGTVKDLETNKKYKFRVKAENIYGISDPLETTAAITVKPPYGKIVSSVYRNSNPFFSILLAR